jgi:hypothetical protein
MPMSYNHQKYQEITMILLKISAKKIFFIGLFYPMGEPILLHLLRCAPFAVDHHSCMDYASHLQQPRFVNKSSLMHERYDLINMTSNMRMPFGVSPGDTPRFSARLHRQACVLKAIYRPESRTGVSTISDA